MIQRPQTLWLLLSMIAGGLSFYFPFAVGESKGEPDHTQIIVDAGSTLFLLLLTLLTEGIAIITLFLYKNRKTQLWFSVLGILGSAWLLFLYAIEMKKLLHPIPALTSLLAVAILGGFIMARIGIRRDEKLIRSQHTLR